MLCMFYVFLLFFQYRLNPNVAPPVTKRIELSGSGRTPSGAPLDLKAIPLSGEKAGVEKELTIEPLVVS